MGFWNDVKQEWTWAGIKKSFQEDWQTLLIVAISGFLTPIVMKWLGREGSTLEFFLVNITLFLLISIVTGVIIGLTRKKQK
ncbi:MAG: hypothetical protein J6Y59_09495 [Bacteroidaceae bacterium]|nr:hypothetical protein [Bacteroidaceae bacterium]